MAARKTGVRRGKNYGRTTGRTGIKRNTRKTTRKYGASGKVGRGKNVTKRTNRKTGRTIRSRVTGSRRATKEGETSEYRAKLDPIGSSQRKLGPATRRLSTKAEWTRGECFMLRCTARAKTPQGKWCKKHYVTVRKAQLLANNRVWRKRVKHGEAGHHIVYKGKPTEWAVEHPEKALRIAKAGHTILPDPKKLKVLLEKAA